MPKLSAFSRFLEHTTVLLRCETRSCASCVVYKMLHNSLNVSCQHLIILCTLILCIVYSKDQGRNKKLIPVSDAIEYGGVLKNVLPDVTANHSSIVKAAKFAVSYGEKRFPHAFYIDPASKKVPAYKIINPRILKVQFTQNDQEPFVFQDIDPVTMVPVMMALIWGYTYSFQLTWPEIHQAFIHNFTVTEHYDDTLHVTSHSFFSAVKVPSENELYSESHFYSKTCHKLSKCDSDFDTDYQRACPNLPWFYLTKYYLKEYVKGCVYNRQDPISDSVIPSPHSSFDNYLCDIVDHNHGFISGKQCLGQSSPPVNLSILSYNIWNTNSVERTSKHYIKRIKQLAKLCKTSGADVIGFQEVRFEADSGGKLGPNQVKHLATILADYQFVYQPAQIQSSRLPARAEEGVAVFSRHPIIDSNTILLSRDHRDIADSHQRVLLDAVIDVQGYGPIHVITTHLSLSHVARRRSVREAWTYIKTLTDPVFFLGDFNAEGHNEEIRYLAGKTDLDGEKTSGFLDVWETMKGPQEVSQGYTFNTLDGELSKRIDFIFSSQHPHLKIRNISLFDDGGRRNRASSDHIGLLANFTLLNYSKCQNGR